MFGHCIGVVRDTSIGAVRDVSPATQLHGLKEVCGC